MAEPLVLIPGMMCDAHVFLPQIVAFSGTRPVQVAQITEYETIEDIAGSVLETAPPKFALAGHGMGGIVAMEIVRRAPERLSRVALISTHAQAERPAQAAEREPQMVLAQSGRLAEVVSQLVTPDNLAAGPVQADVLALLQHMAGTLGPDVFIRQSRAMQRRPDQQKTLRITRVPAFVICGRMDTINPVRRHEFMSELIPHGHLRIIEDAGHLPMIEAPEATTAALNEWLTAPFVLR